MAVDEKLLEALSNALADLKHNPQKPVPASIIKALAPLAEPAMKLKLDIDASRVIGAPLVTMGGGASSDVNSSKTEFLSSLTARQKQVAELVIEGLTNPEIAEKLSISVATVKDHVHAI